MIDVGVSPDYQPTPTGLNPNRPYRLDNGIIKRRVEQGKWLPFQANNPPDTVTPPNLHQGIIYPEWPHVAVYEQPGSVDGELINYPVFITIPYVSGYMRSDFQDIRFATLDGRKLDYCFVDCVDGDHADFYVKIPDLPASPSVTNIKVYCGNLSVITTANAKNMFNNLSAYYQLNESSGSVLHDLSGNENDGTIYNSPSVVEGRYGKVILWNGSNQYAIIPVAVDMDWTICFWLTSTQSAYSSSQWYQGAGLIDGEVGGVTSDYGITFGAGKVLYGIGNPDTTITSTAINDGKPHFIVATRKANTGIFTLYVDGIQVATATGGTGQRHAMNQLSVAISTSGNYFNGTIERLLFYSTVKSLSDIPYTENEPTTGILGAWSETRYVLATENVMVQGNVLGDSPMSAPKPDDDIVFEVDGIEYKGLENFQIEKRGNDAASTFNVSYLTADDLVLMTGQKIIFKERYGDKDGFYSGAIQDIKDSNVDSERTWTISGRDTGSKLISQPFTLACVESNPTQYTSYQLLDMILDGMGVELGPCVDITVTGIVNQNNVFKGFGGNWGTRAAALNDLLALCSRVLGKNINWFIDKKGLLRIFYTDVPDTSIGISILKDNPRMLSLEVDENSENLVNDLTGTAGENNNITTHLQDNSSINGWTDPDTGLSWPGYGTQTGEPIQDSTITKQSDLNAKVQNELNLHSKPIFTATIVLSRFPDCEMGQPVYFPDHYKLRGMTFVITAITLNGDSADRTTTIVATTDRSIIGPLSDYEAVNSIAKYAVKEYAPFTAVVTDVGKNGVTVQPVNEPGTVNARNLGG